MIKFKTSALAILLSFALFSCSSVYQYGPGNLGHETRLLITPGNKDSIRTTHNISGRYSFNLGKGYNPNESCRFGEAFYHLGYSAKYFSGAVGAGLFGGSYQVREFSIDPGWKNFFGMNGAGQAAFNIPLGPFNWRIIGVRGGFSGEGGALYDFRKKHQNTPGFDSFTASRFLGYGGTYSELMYSKNDYRFGLSSNTVFQYDREGFLGMASGISLFAGYQNVSFIYQMTDAMVQGQNHSLGLVIRLP